MLPSGGAASSEKRAPGVRLRQPLHLLHVFPTFDLGGAQTRVVTLANALGGRYRHTVFALDGKFGAARLFDAGLRCDLETLALAPSGSLHLGNVMKARGLLRKLRPDLLLTYNWGSIEWALANWLRPICRHIHGEDGFGPDESPLRQLRRRVIMRRIALHRCAHVIVPSHTLYDLATQLWRLSPAQVMYLPNGIDCTRFDRPPDAGLLAEIGVPDGVPVIGTVAALRPEKNLLRLVTEFAQLPPALGAWLLIVGDGPQRDMLAAAAAQLGIADRVAFAGAVMAPERLIGRFDVFALSSNTEQMPYSVLEAMASGRAIAATDVGDVKRMVAAENAPFVVPADEEHALTTALGALLADEARRTRIGNANRERVRAEYALETMIRRYDALFSAVGRAD